MHGKYNRIPRRKMDPPRRKVKAKKAPPPRTPKNPLQSGMEKFDAFAMLGKDKFEHLTDFMGTMGNQRGYGVSFEQFMDYAGRMSLSVMNMQMEMAGLRRVSEAELRAIYENFKSTKK
jgi:hypothetical protein